MSAPLQWFTCEACDGSGVQAFRVSVYEHGCGFPHDDTDERPCPECLGDGGFVGEALADAERCA